MKTKVKLTDDWKWLRVKNGNKYGYVKVNSENKPIEFNKSTGLFKVYDLPNNKAYSFEASKKTQEEIEKERDVANGIELWGDFDEIVVTPQGNYTNDWNQISNELFQTRVQDERNKEISRNIAIDNKVKQYAFTPEGFFGQALQPTNLLSPTHTGRGIYNWVSGNGYGDMRDLFLPNSGVFSDEFAKEHPYLTMAGNVLTDALTFGTGSAFWKMPKYRAAMQAENRAAQEAMANSWDDMLNRRSIVRTKLGDVEVDNPGLHYRQGTPEMVEDFVNKGTAEAKQFPNPMFNLGSLFYNFPKRKGFTLNFNRRGTNGLIVTSEDMLPAGGDATALPLSELDETLTARIPKEKITTSNASAYIWEPGYGYRQVHPSQTKALSWEEATRPNIKVGIIDELPRETYTYNPKTGEFIIQGPTEEWIQAGEKLVPEYFQSPEEWNRLIASGATPEQALRITTTRALNAENTLPYKFENLGDNVYGQSENINGRALITYNSSPDARAALNTPETTLNTVFHEVGGHGSSLNIGENAVSIPENMVKTLEEIYKHNEALRPLLKPFYQAVKDGDVKTAKELLAGMEDVPKTLNGELEIKKMQDMIKYMEENQEYVARAHATNMSNHYQLPEGWNEMQLRKYYTKESVDKLLKGVWSVLPVGIGINHTSSKK